MSRREFRSLISGDRAREIIQGLGIRASVEDVELAEAGGRVLAEDVYAPVDVPPFTRAAMDGYAVVARDTYGAREDRPVHLRLEGRVQAGEDPPVGVGANECVEVATGAVLPRGANAVVMVEYTREEDGHVVVQRGVSPGENVMQAGADIMLGELVLKEGTKLGSRDLGVLASIGLDRVPVRRLQVGVISTGDEITQPGKHLNPGEIYDANTYSIATAIRENGAEPIIYGVVGDDEGGMRRVMDRAAGECDVVITSGSTSAGAGDRMYRIIEEQGEILAHGIDIKPGKPMIIGRYGKPFFGLPGYPTSALTTFNEFVAPAIRDAIGIEKELRMVTARLAVDVRSPGRRQLLPVGLVRGLAYPVDKGSGAITTLAEADGYVDIPGDVEIVHEEEEVEVHLYGEVTPPDLLFIGSHDLGVDVLSSLIPYETRVISTGSTGGLSAMRRGIPDVAGVHLLHPQDGYNEVYIREYQLKDVTLVKGYLREQGIITRPDSTIESVEDMIGVRIINRSAGSGTRVLFDAKLEEIVEARGVGFEELVSGIRGYDVEARTHGAVAAAVKTGKADAGIGIKPFADQYGLRFTPIAEEEYDFVVRDTDTAAVRAFLNALNSPEFASRLPDGVRVYERTGEQIEF